VARITSATAIGGITGNDAINVQHRGLIDFNAFESSTFKHRDISQIILDRKLRGSNRRRLAPRAISKSESIVFSKLYEIGTRPCFIAPLRLGDRSTAIRACRAPARRTQENANATARVEIEEGSAVDRQGGVADGSAPKSARTEKRTTPMQDGACSVSQLAGYCST
jgi:hypothetical protein